ncbi:hypothetical protein ACKW6Q_19095 [Chryseobacterium kwangjuense]|uniref:Lipoprotein n=1 Tax=Chryseobacterium kwangjuense TaxID=267125 RepID=A0ABW9K6Z9_9FLAO
MTIIKRKSNSFINTAFIFVIVFFIGCKSQIVSNSNCTLATSDKEMLLDMGTDNEILKNELQEFYSNNNKYDIIFYKSQPGEINLTFKRIYKNKDNKWLYTEVFNSKILTQKEININDSDFDSLFNNFENIGMYKNCGMCFGCYSYFNLIKHNNKTFSYYYDSLSGNLSSNDLEKLESYLKILNFFNQYNLTFIEQK